MNYAMEDKYIEFLRDIIGREWLEEEFKKIDTKSPLKEVGSMFIQYHPWVHFMYEIDYLLRRADIEQHEEVVMGKYWYILRNAGMLLMINNDDIVDHRDAQMKLRNAEQFYDFIWELEVKTMLSKNGADVTCIDPKNGITHDGVAKIFGYCIPYECKNKICDNSQYNSNQMFSQMLVKKLEGVVSIRNKIIQIEFESGRLEDLKTIVAYIRDNFDVIDYRSILGRYKIRTLSKLPFNTPVQTLFKREGINQVFCIAKCDKKELYMDIPPSGVVMTKLLFKMPGPINELHNLNGVLKKANTQLPPGGVVFLQVPYCTFENTIKAIEKELSQSFSNISAVKIVSLKEETIANYGVKVSRLEDVVVSQRAKKIIPPDVIEFLNKPMAFGKYAGS